MINPLITFKQRNGIHHTQLGSYYYVVLFYGYHEWLVKVVNYDEG